MNNWYECESCVKHFQLDNEMKQCCIFCGAEEIKEFDHEEFLEQRRDSMCAVINHLIDTEELLLHEDIWQEFFCGMEISPEHKSIYLLLRRSIGEARKYSCALENIVGLPK